MTETYVLGAVLSHIGETMTNQMERAIALAAFGTAAYYVQRLSIGKSIKDERLDVLVGSLFKFDAPNTAAVYENQILALKEGAFLLGHLLKPGNHQQYKQVTRILYSLLHQAQRLKNSSRIRNDVKKRLIETQPQAELVGLSHPQLISTIADIYRQTFGKLRHKIKIAGSVTHLQQPYTQALIRTLLLTGIRSAYLWRQLGGNDWHLILKKKQAQESVSELFKYIQSIEEKQWSTQP